MESRNALTILDTIGRTPLVALDHLASPERSRVLPKAMCSHMRTCFSTFNKSFNRMRVRDTGGWWRIVIDYGAKSAKFCLGEGEHGAIPTSASTILLRATYAIIFPKKVKQACGFWH